jgi:glycosyltransferase involved in cell wall biosynthesis
MEAMAYGIPCVVMKVPGTPNELIKNEENGFLIKPDHLMDLTIKLSILIRNADYRQKLGSKARENMRIYNLDTTMKRWLKLLDEIETKKKHK